MKLASPYNPFKSGKLRYRYEYAVIDDDGTIAIKRCSNSFDYRSKTHYIPKEVVISIAADLTDGTGDDG